SAQLWILKLQLTLGQGIASTLVIVRSALGLAIKDEESFRATVLQDNRTGTTPGWISSVINIHQHHDAVGGIHTTQDEEEGSGPALVENSNKVESAEAQA
ncbi:hypothetical protein V5O48_019206, partial [Marasmius crinis-equi]